MAVKNGWSFDWLSGLWTFKPNHRKLAVLVMFRLQPNYVSSVNILKYFILLQSINSKGVPNDDVITAISVVFELWRFRLKL